MKINKKLFEEFKNSKNSKLLAVTKYWNSEETKKFILQLSLEEKNILV
jgi:inorganic pyrophosphatase